MDHIRPHIDGWYRCLEFYPGAFRDDGAARPGYLQRLRSGAYPRNRRGFCLPVFRYKFPAQPSVRQLELLHLQRGYLLLCFDCVQPVLLQVLFSIGRLQSHVTTGDALSTVLDSGAKGGSPEDLTGRLSCKVGSAFSIRRVSRSMLLVTSAMGGPSMVSMISHNRSCRSLRSETWVAAPAMARRLTRRRLVSRRAIAGAATQVSELKERQERLWEIIETMDGPPMALVTSSMEWLTRLIEKAEPTLLENLPVESLHYSSFYLQSSTVESASPMVT